MKPPIAFDAEGARLIVRATREAIRRPKGRVPKQAGPRLLQPLKYMVVTRAVQAATAGGPGLGYGRFCTVAYDDDDAATWGDPDGDEYPLYTIDTSAPTPVGKRVAVGIIDGRAHILLELC